MPKVSIYLPDLLYRQAQEKGLSLSSLAQRAVERALKESSAADWVVGVRSREARFRGTIDTADLLDRARDEFGK
ncbi:MAG: toxin-antitoxin system HicB family antitoxin [Actinomycetota bacterium]